MVEELQVGGAGLVGRDRIERQAQAVDGSQPGLDQDQDRGAGGEIREAVQRLLALELAHHELVDEPGQRSGLVRDLAAVVGRVGRQSGRPIVQPDVVEEHLQRGQVAAAPRRRHRQRVHVRAVVLQDCARDLRRARGQRVAVGQPRCEGPQRARRDRHRRR